MLPVLLFLRLIFLSLSFGALVNGAHGERDGGDDDGDDASPTSSASSATTSSATSTSNSTSGLTGDHQCPGSQLLCVTATVNGSTTTYELQSTGAQSLGWMAIGFGGQMTGSPMVIMWPNADGTVTVSQRQAPSEVMPTPVANPPRVATVATSLSTLTGSQPKLVFTIDTDTAAQQSHIWAFGNVKPDEASDSTLQQHLDSGPFNLDLTKAVDPSLTPSPLPVGASHIPLMPYQKTIIAHAVLATVGFLFLLPIGALLARYIRTVSPKWFVGHWVIQAGLGGPVILVGIILAFVAVNQQGVYVPSTHKTLGRALLGIYLGQCFLGAFIHYVKVPFRFGRPPQNYAHAVLGLTMVALALYQVRLGYREEWPNMTGRGSVGSGVNTLWIVWTVLLPVLYFGGLAFLPRQLRQERASKESRESSEQNYSMSTRERENNKLNRDTSSN